MSLKASYHICGFDCPNCAAKTERALNNVEEIETATIDFPNERLHLSFKERELSLEEIKNLVDQVEDNIEITPLDEFKASKSIFDREFYIKLSRIIVSLLMAIFTKIFVNCADNFLLALILYSVAAIICLYDILWKVVRNIVKKNNPIDMNLLLSISSLGVLTLGSLIHYQVLPKGPFEIDLLDGVLVVALYQVGELLEHVASNKSKRAIKSAIDLRADYANLYNNNAIEKVAPETLEVGDKIIVNVGDIIPVDGVIISGIGSLDTSSLTGESLPVDVKENTQVLSGCLVKNGSLIIKVEKAYQDSTVSKIMELVESSGERKSKAEKFITKFARIYTPIVFLTGITYALTFGLITHEWAKAIFGGLAILVVSCPCAIVISVPMAYFAGIGLSSRHGIIVKGSNYLDALCNVGTLFIDKTGTLTYGNFEVSEIKTVGKKEELLEALLIAESRSNHPLAKAVIKDHDVSKYIDDITSYEEFAGEGIKAVYNGQILIAGTQAFLEKNSVKTKYNEVKSTVIHVAKNGEYLGYVSLKDKIREDAKEMIKKLNDSGVKVILLSGDKESSVKEVAESVGISEYHHSLLPGDKTVYVERAIENKIDKKLVAFAGDGINDSPSILRADIGFAMGGVGSDAAIESADVVLMDDNPKKISDSIQIAHKVRFVAIFNIIFSLLIKIGVIVLILTGILKQYGMIIAVLADTGLTVVMIIHSLTLIYRKID